MRNIRFTTDGKHIMVYVDGEFQCATLIDRRGVEAAIQRAIDELDEHGIFDGPVCEFKFNVDAADLDRLELDEAMGGQPW